jgi:hypothetical protein
VVFLAVFTFVNSVLKGGISNYAAFLLSGLLAWNHLLRLGAQWRAVVISNANLVKKVYFPREILPLATVGVGSSTSCCSRRCSVLPDLFGYGFQADVSGCIRSRSSTAAVLTCTHDVRLALNVRYRDVST